LVCAIATANPDAPVAVDFACAALPLIVTACETAFAPALISAKGAVPPRPSHWQLRSLYRHWRLSLVRYLLGS
jgi:hypothetical protein